jgi:hypothetical protein
MSEENFPDRPTKPMRSPNVPEQPKNGRLALDEINLWNFDADINDPTTAKNITEVLAEKTVDFTNDVSPQKTDFHKESIKNPEQDKRTLFSMVEKISLAIFLLFLLIGTIFIYKTARRQINDAVNPYENPKYPITGSFVRIKDAKAYWRGTNDDDKKKNMILVPEIEITLENCPTTSGVLKVFYKDDKGKRIGDTTSVNCQNNVFDKSLSSTIKISCSVGFKEKSDQEAYRAKIMKPWTVEILEGESKNTPISGFKKLFSTPVSVDIK